MTDPIENTKHTKLHQSFTFWFTFFKKGKEKQIDEFEENLKEIGSISTAEEFWGIYQHMKRPSNLTRGCEFFLFKKDIKPMWEDPANHNGGRFIILAKKIAANNKIWEDMLVAFIMLDQSGDYLNGLVLNVRTHEIYISLWTKTLSTEQYAKTIDWLKSIIELTTEISIDYKHHPSQEELTSKQGMGIREEEDRTARLMSENLEAANSQEQEKKTHEN